jgi:hypothetical protein
VVGGLALELGEPPTHHPCRDDEHRQQHQRQQRHLPGDAEHHHEGQGEQDEVAGHARQRVAERALRPDDVVVEAADQGAGAGAGEEGDGHALDVVEDRGAQRPDEPLAERRRQPAGDQPERGLRDRDERDEDGEHRHGPHGVAGDDGVHDPAGEQGSGDRQHGAHHAERQEAQDASTVGPRERPDPSDGRPRDVPLLRARGRAAQRHPGGHLHVHEASEGGGVPWSEHAYGP